MSSLWLQKIKINALSFIHSFLKIRFCVHSCLLLETVSWHLDVFLFFVKLGCYPFDIYLRLPFNHSYSCPAITLNVKLVWQKHEMINFYDERFLRVKEITKSYITDTLGYIMEKPRLTPDSSEQHFIW